MYKVKQVKTQPVESGDEYPELFKLKSYLFKKFGEYRLVLDIFGRVDIFRHTCRNFGSLKSAKLFLCRIIPVHIRIARRLMALFSMIGIN